MTNYREILRLQSLGLNKTEIAASLHCARNTVAATLQRADNCGLQWPLPDEMSDKQLAERLFPSAPGKPAYKINDLVVSVIIPCRMAFITLRISVSHCCSCCFSTGVMVSSCSCIASIWQLSTKRSFIGSPGAAGSQRRLHIRSSWR